MKKLLHALCVLMAAELLISCVSTKTSNENVKLGSDEEFLAQEQVVEESALEYKQGRNRMYAVRCFYPGTVRSFFR